MGKDKQKKRREYARRRYREECEDLKKRFLKSHGITSKTNREIVLKKICKYWLMGIWEIAKSIGGGLTRPKDKEWSKGLDRMFKRQLLSRLTRDLRKAGILPLASYGKKKPT